MSLQRYYNILPYLIIVSAFGVYIGEGIRVEHLIIYPSILLFLCTSLLARKRLLKDYFLIFLAWLAVVMIALIVSFFNGGQLSSIVADAESFIQPIFLMILLIFLTINNTSKDASDKLITSSKIFIFMLCLNSIFIFISMFRDVTEIGSLFWGSEGDSSVAYRAMTNGRYSGVFNQPMEAGVAYSIGLFVWLYLSDKINVFKIKYVISLYLMVIGGLVTVSKVFLFGGLLLFFIGILLNKNLFKMVFKLTFWSITLGGIAYYFLFKTWTGLNYLFRFFNPTEGFLTLMTAGRFGGNSTMENYFSIVWNESPIYGRGFGVTETYDSGFFQFFAIGGSIGLVIYISILLVFFWFSVKFLKQNKFGSESKLFAFLTVLIIGSGIGAPTLTLNRASTVLWIFIGLLFQYFHFEKLREKDHLIKSKAA